MVFVLVRAASAVCWVGLAVLGAGVVVGFGEVVEADGLGCGLGDVFGAVADGGDGGGGWLADQSGEGSGAAGGALVEAGGVAGECSGLVVLEVEVVFDGGGDVAERLVGAVAGGEGAAADQGGASGELGASHAGEQGVSVTLMPAWTKVAATRSRLEDVVAGSEDVTVQGR
ncbi:hypothetical protein [Streptomyces brevispora]|uniref:hypothetical protein n=1 Tax=Streptomyces brevispora TaxID=887462 RepID=UPI0035D955C9